MTPDPKLVEALARLICHQTVSDEAPVGCRDCERAAREFFAEHRLVQLPEEPTEWEVQWGLDDWVGFQTMEDAVNFANEHRPSTTGQIRAVHYVVKYSDPQEVEP